MLIIENCNSLSDLRQKLIDGEEVRTVRQEPCKVSEYDKDHIWYKGNQYISLRRFLEVKAEAEKKPCEDAINKTEVIKAIDEREDANGKVDAESIRTDIVLMLPVKTQELCEDWYDVPSDEMTLGQARQAVKDLRKKLAEYLEQEPCEDAISRHAAIDTIESWLSCDNYNKAERHIMRATQSMLYDLPPVNPTKTGHWIEHPEIETSVPEYLMFYECSECGDKLCFCKPDIHKKRFCNYCGCRMVEPQERIGEE